jgi:fimbrial chaperone protein
MRVLSSLVASAILLGTTAWCADLRVAPVTVDAMPGDRTGTVVLTNAEDHPITAQIRIFRWTQVNGKDDLQPTTDVVVSPPMATLAARQDYLVRIVRTSKAPITGEESYRILVDQLPEKGPPRPGEVKLVLRESIPVFFSDEPKRTPKIEWSLQRSGAGFSVVGKNVGNRRVRLSDFSVSKPNGAAVWKTSGLSGYVLANSEMRWSLPPSPAALGSVKLTAQTDAGPIDVALTPAPAR